MYWLILGDTDKIIVIFGRIILRSFSPLMEKHVLPFYQSVISAKKMKGADSGGNKHVFHRRQHFNEKTQDSYIIHIYLAHFVGLPRKLI